MASKTKGTLDCTVVSKRWFLDWPPVRLTSNCPVMREAMEKVVPLEGNGLTRRGILAWGLAASTIVCAGRGDAFAAVSQGPQPGDPTWLKSAFGELGVSDTLGGRESQILGYLRTVYAEGNSNIRLLTPWCSAFANWCMIQAGRNGSGSARAMSWEDWKGGRPVTDFRRGDVLVFRMNDGRHQTAFFLDRAGGQVSVIGGHIAGAIGTSVAVVAFPTTWIVVHRRPNGWG